MKVADFHPLFGNCVSWIDGTIAQRNVEGSWRGCSGTEYGALQADSMGRIPQVVQWYGGLMGLSLAKAPELLT